jgi:Flp pilus assembly protein TadD
MRNCKSRCLIILALIFISGLIISGCATTGMKTADISEPREITDIRLLLQEGKNERAVEKARAYVASLENVGGFEAQQCRYYGLNALCAALTSTGELDEAIDTCNQAITLFPTRWQALNTRGTAYYVSGQIDLALTDYRQALSQLHRSDPLTDLIKHNIGLAKAKKLNTN